MTKLDAFFTMQCVVGEYIKEKNIKPTITKKCPNIEAGDMFEYDEEKKLFYTYRNINEIIKSEEFKKFVSERYKEE